MGTLSGLFVHLNTLKEMGEGKTLLLKIKNKQVKGETERIEPRCFTNLDQTALRAPGYLIKHAVQFHPLMCPRKVEFLENTYGCPTLSEQIDWVSMVKFFVGSVWCQCWLCK